MTETPSETTPEAPPAQARDAAARIADAVQALPGGGARRLIAVAGPPASGKSTLAALARDTLIRRGVPTGLVAMDGFHFDNRILHARGQIARKGAPETFDVAGFRALLHRLATEDEVAVPEFDRAKDLAIAARALIRPDQRIVLVEGNYLLLNEPGWAECAEHWALTVFLDVPLDVLEDRLVARWLDHGLAPEDAVARARSNDIPNARRTVETSRRADLVLRTEGEGAAPGR